MTALPISATKLQKTSSMTLTYDMKTLLISAANTGIGAGLVSYLLFPEGAFTKPALYTAGAAAAVYYLSPAGDALTRSAMIGAGMAAEVMLFAAGQSLEGMIVPQPPVSGALRFGALGAVAAYISTEFITPKLLRAENAVARDYKF